MPNYPSGYPAYTVPVVFADGDDAATYPSGYPRDPVPVQPIGEDGEPVELVTLVGGKVPSSMLPQVAISDAFVVADRSAMLALDVQQGDVAVVTADDDGLSRTYILAGDDPDPSVFGDWVALPSPGDVNSVNGHLGVVVLSASDVGAVEAATGTSPLQRVYSVEADGSQSRTNMGASPIANAIARRTSSGALRAAAAAADDELINKSQLDAVTTRGTVTHTTSSLADQAEEASTVELGKSFRLQRVETSVPARVRLYATAAQQTADASRALGTDPTGDHGVLLDMDTTSDVLGYSLSPQVDGSSLESTPSADIAVSVQNLSGSAAAVTVTFTRLVTEV